MKGKVDYTKVSGYKPEDQRRCLNCGIAMKPNVLWVTLADDAEGENVVKRYTEKQRPACIEYYGYGPEELFCTLTCGYNYACRAIQAAKVKLAAHVLPVEESHETN